MRLRGIIGLDPVMSGALPVDDDYYEDAYGDQGSGYEELMREVNGNAA